MLPLPSTSGNDDVSCSVEMTSPPVIELSTIQSSDHLMVTAPDPSSAELIGAPLTLSVPRYHRRKVTLQLRQMVQPFAGQRDGTTHWRSTEQGGNGKSPQPD